MTDQVEKKARGSNKCKWIKLFLVISLALNVAFLGPLIYNWLSPADEGSQYTGESTTKNGTMQPSGKKDPLSPGPGHQLNEQQKEKIDAIIRGFKLTLMQYKQDILAKRIEIIDELGDPEYDPQTITTRTNELNQLENNLNLLFVKTLLEIDTILDERQRLDFLYKLSRNWFFLDKRRHGRRFDHRNRETKRVL